MIRRMGFVSGLLLALVFAAPAFESHACPDEASFAGAQAVADVATGDDAQCPDCGPACANGCCHAPHPAVQTEVATPRLPTVFSLPLAWADAPGRALDSPAGPDRPPRP